MFVVSRLVVISALVLSFCVSVVFLSGSSSITSPCVVSQSFSDSLLLLYGNLNFLLRILLNDETAAAVASSPNFFPRRH